MDKYTIEDIHQKNYIEAVKEIIIINSNSLVDDDINSLIKKPPLDSMDSIRNKFIELAKKYKITINTSILEESLEKYREEMLNDINFIKEVRIKTLTDSIKKSNIEDIKISKQTLNNINKKINSFIKKKIPEEIEVYLIENIDTFYTKFNSDSEREKIIKEIEKYFKKIYQKQLIENINLKIVVKDTTLINGSREQKERYIFTKNNSRINEL